MTGDIVRLEQEQEGLKASNAQMIEENRYLLDQLEEMNQTISTGEVQVKSLTATLQFSKQENARLASLAARAADLESQLSEFESEQCNIRGQIRSKEEDERTAFQRWKTAERTIADLQDQVDKIEKEALEERARHGEVVGRLERRNVVERELGNAAGRLKGAAAVTRLEDSRIGTSVVSHFVKDILQDNANLQMGIMELKDMLSGSNAEVQNLREQMLMHQDVMSTPDEAVTAPSLAEELIESPRLEALPELHVHHHYHAPAKPRSTSVKRPKKKRNVTSLGFSTPSSTPSGQSTPCRYSSSLPRVPGSSSLAILSHTAVTVPPTQEAEWPITVPRSRASFAASSVPSTPQSAFRNLSIFDSIDFALESSRPTSPESVASEIPRFEWPRRQRPSNDHTPVVDAASGPGKCSSSDPSDGSHPAAWCLSPIIPPHEISHDPASIPEENEDSNPSFSHQTPFHHTLYRSSSHESILSVKESLPLSSRGTIRPQHSQLFNGPAQKSKTSIAPITTSETATAQRPAPGSNDALLTRGQDLLMKAVTGSQRSYSSVAAAYDESGCFQKDVDKRNNQIDRNGASMTNPGIASRLNGWFIGNWGVTPTPTVRASTSNLRAKAALGAQLEKSGAASSVQLKSTTANAITSLSTPPLPTMPKLKHRPRTTGINQPGAIRGLVLQQQQVKQAERMVVVEPKEVDLEGLRESLGDG